MRIADDVAWTQHDDEVVVLNLATSAAEPLVLEGSAAIVWEVIAESGSTDLVDLVHVIAVDMALVDEEIRGDVEAFVETLRARSLISD